VPEAASLGDPPLSTSPNPPVMVCRELLSKPDYINDRWCDGSLMTLSKRILSLAKKVPITQTKPAATIIIALIGHSDKVQMPRYFTHYWSNSTWLDHAERFKGQPLHHTAGNQFIKRGIEPGDFV